MSLDQLPADVILYLLYFVRPEDSLTLRCVNRRLRELSGEPLLWKYYCHTRFKFWANSKCFDELNNPPLANLHPHTWRDLFISRLQKNRDASLLLHRIIKTKAGRLQNYWNLCALGYDVKDYLVEVVTGTPDIHPDALARRFFAQRALDIVQKHVALSKWTTVISPGETRQTPDLFFPLEKLIGAFDMMYLCNGLGDIDTIVKGIDDLAHQFRLTYHYSVHLSTRKLALILLSWLRQKGLVGVKEGPTHHETLRNQFIGQVLQHQQTPSLAVTSNTIYCAVAGRLGINADFGCFDGKINGIVRITSPPNKTLDDVDLGEADVQHRLTDWNAYDKTIMYLETLENGIEISRSNLERKLQENYLPPLPHYPPRARLRDLLLIMSTALRRSVRMYLPEDEDDAERLLAKRSVLQHRGPFPLSEFYVSCWASMVCARRGEAHIIEIIKRFVSDWVGSLFPEDVWLLRQLPVLSESAEAGSELERERQKLLDRLTRIELDHETPKIWRRSDFKTDIPFKIGQIVRHRRFGWIGIVVGWSIKLRPSIMTDHAKGGAKNSPQAYINCLGKSDVQYRFTPDSLEIVKDPDLIALDDHPLAGRYFKQFDKTTCTFVSNIRDIFPED